jgi:hypothetical protein
MAASLSRPPELATPRLVLRDLRLADAAAVAAGAGDGRVAQYLIQVPSPYPISLARRWVMHRIEWWELARGVTFAVALRDEPDALIGTVSLRCYARDRRRGARASRPRPRAPRSASGFASSASRGSTPRCSPAIAPRSRSATSSEWSTKASSASTSTRAGDCTTWCSTDCCVASGRRADALSKTRSRLQRRRRSVRSRVRRPRLAGARPRAGPARRRRAAQSRTRGRSPRPRSRRRARASAASACGSAGRARGSPRGRRRDSPWSSIARGDRGLQSHIGDSPPRLADGPTRWPAYILASRR